LFSAHDAAPPPSVTSTLSLHDALPIWQREDFIDVNIRGTFNLLEEAVANGVGRFVFTSTTSLMISEAIRAGAAGGAARAAWLTRSEEHTSELQSLTNLVCRLLLEKKK